MIAELINRDSFLKCVRQLELALVKRRAELQRNDTKAATAADVQGVEIADLDSALHQLGMLNANALQESEKDDTAAAWLPRDRVASLVQSLLEDFYVDAEAVQVSADQGLADGKVPITDVSLRLEWSPDDLQRLARPFENTDPEWIFSFAAAKALKDFLGQHPFPENTPPTVTLGNTARVILVGDWGSGIPRAVNLGQKMRDRLFEREANGKDLHVIHLGDVYYSGFRSEYKNRFLRHWPVKESERARIGSWCLNGNHDMFAGGKAYFEFLLRDPRFTRHAGASYFALENDHWQVLGLDTAYDPPDSRGNKGNLFGPQAQWVTNKRAGAPGKKALLLSHHQLFSAYEGDSPLIAAKLASVIAKPDGITAWFWGHEHRCAIYDHTHPVKNARLVGHGGVPVYASKNALPPGVRWEFTDSFRFGFETFARFGFAVLDFDQDHLQVQYIDEDGLQKHVEVIN